MRPSDKRVEELANSRGLGRVAGTGQLKLVTNRRHPSLQEVKKNMRQKSTKLEVERWCAG